jgi:hypothetical protein
MKKRILFLLKDRHYSPSKGSYGLINSASQVAEFLTDLGNTCEVITVNDSNGIDKECFKFKPDVVILEALWITAYKLKELLNIKRYNKILWVVRVHSDMGYLSTETQGLKHLNDYIALESDRLILSLNNNSFVKALSNALDYTFEFLPNVITTYPAEKSKESDNNYMDIACFGALRLLKNQCFQAICSINAANRLGKILRFHITHSVTVEYDPVLENLKQLFKDSEHQLVIHGWLDTKDFYKLIAKMDIGLQLSYTESFNIVTADFINNNKLILVSESIDWMSNIMKISTTDYNKVTNDIIFLYKARNSYILKKINKVYLSDYNTIAKKTWINFLKHI